VLRYLVLTFAFLKTVSMTMMDNQELKLEAYGDDELQAALKELFSFSDFLLGMKSFLPDTLYQHIMKQKDEVETILDFQKSIIRPFLLYIKELSIKEITTSGLGQLTPGEKYLFISNHRDIVLDSAFLNMVLLKHGFETCQIAIGDNLMKHRLAELLFRVNKSYVIKREGTPRELYSYSVRVSSYLHDLISNNKDSAWIAQREGRAKDGNDFTQPGVLKMLSLSKKRDIKSHFKTLKVVPVAISYEIDPCAILKAREYLRKQADPTYKKAFQDDVDYIFQGLKGQKGRIHIAFGAPLADQLDELDKVAGDKKQLNAIVKQIDDVIHQHYRLHPINYVALDLLNQSKENEAHYSVSEFEQYKAYFEEQLQCLKPEFKEEGFRYLLGIYANPVVNYLSSQTNET